jgi:KaiC/GvpD/RAD55 family RecA-like ATPase
MASCQHILQVYGRQDALLDALEDFVSSGLEAGECVIVVATRSHREALDARLEAGGHDMRAVIADDRFIALSAHDTLERFMVRGKPDEALLRSTLGPVLARGRAGGRKVRAFGEMVALLWARGNHDATVDLELLWNRVLQEQEMPLFCAYPSVGFNAKVTPQVNAIRAAHSHVVEG